jgi:hypothetical protein
MFLGCWLETGVVEKLLPGRFRLTAKSERLAGGLMPFEDLDHPVAHPGDVLFDQDRPEFAERVSGGDVEHSQDLFSLVDGQRKVVGDCVEGAFDVEGRALEAGVAEEMGEREKLAVWYFDSGDEHRQGLLWGDTSISQSGVAA